MTPIKEIASAIEIILLRRLHEKRLDGYTLEASEEMALVASRTDPVRDALLEALEALLHALDTDDVGGLVEGQMERVRAAIAAAKGEQK